MEARPARHRATQDCRTFVSKTRMRALEARPLNSSRVIMVIEVEVRDRAIAWAMSARVAVLH